MSPSVSKEIELAISPQTTIDNVPISIDILSLSGDLIVLIKKCMKDTKSQTSTKLSL